MGCEGATFKQRGVEDVWWDMHSYLRAIGFSEYKSRNELDQLFGAIIDRPNAKGMIQLQTTKHVFTEFKKEYGEKFGMAVRGEYDEKSFFHLEHYFPYCLGKLISVKENVLINKRVDTDAYTGMCDDVRLGVSLIFYLQNAIDYLRCKDNYSNGRIVNVSLSALSTEGSVLLGIESKEEPFRNRQAELRQRNQLIMEAKCGNQEAIDSLTIEDIDMYAMVSRRAKTEDVYSIVESSFIPYGSESDNYSVLGNIINWKLTKNTVTDEEVYNILINCNDLIFPVCINRMDLQGEPMIGRRFKGNIWMQGSIDFNELI